MKDDILDWFITSDNKGVSSKAMAAAILDKKPRDDGYTSHPSDPSDFNRCLLLLRHAPESREHMDKIAALSDVWGNLVNAWEELERCFLTEVGLNWSRGRHLKARKTYDMMKSLGC